MKCGAFNSGLTIHPNGKISPCCEFDHRFFKTFHEITDWNDPWGDLRSGQGCDVCKLPGFKYKDTFDPYLSDGDFSLKFLDVRNSNLCNMECVFCGPEYSSKWVERLGHDNRFVETNFNVDLSNLDRIYFAGGEPLLNKKHWEILQQVNNPEKVSLLYSTNLSYLGDVETHWKRFRDVQLNISLDGVGLFGEQIRPGLKWERLQANLHAVKQMTSVEIDVAVACTVSMLNIWHLAELEDWCRENQIRWFYVGLTDPNHFCLSNLPTELKQKITYIPDHDHIKQLLDQQTDSDLFIKGISNVLLGDKLRKTNLWDYLPFEPWAIENIFI